MGNVGGNRRELKERSIDGNTAQNLRNENTVQTLSLASCFPALSAVWMQASRKRGFLPSSAPVEDAALVKPPSVGYSEASYRAPAA